MFAAALIVSCPGIEISIYSTCKRISQKLLRGVQKFIYLICSDNLSSKYLAVVRQVILIHNLSKYCKLSHKPSKTANLISFHFFLYFQQNMEEIVLKGAHSFDDVRIVNSYPSKV